MSSELTLINFYVTMVSHVFSLLFFIKIGYFYHYMKQLTVPKITLFNFIVDMGLSTFINSLLWPYFICTLLIRYTHYRENNYENNYLSVPFLFNPEIYKSVYKLTSDQLNIVPNLYSRRVIFRDDRPLSVLCISIKISTTLVQIIMKCTAVD